jgi:hypothetical protein
MGGEYPKGGGAIFLEHSPLWGGAIFLGFSSPGAVFQGISPPFERGLISGGGGGGGGDKSYVTSAWASSSTFLKIISCPPQKYEFAPQIPPPPKKNSEAWRRQ